jgi:hypothetical protein
MRFQTLRLQTSDFRHTLSAGNLSAITHGLFKILTPSEKNYVIKEKKSPVGSMDEDEIDEIRSLENLENCANAARETEGLGQFE